MLIEFVDIELGEDGFDEGNICVVKVNVICSFWIKFYLLKEEIFGIV